MANDRDQELERLEKELLADIMNDDDLLADIPIELLDTTPAKWDDTVFFTDEELLNLNFDDPEITPEPNETEESTEQPVQEDEETVKAREDKWLIVLMAIASFLCLGIIGVFIYWLEVFLK